MNILSTKISQTTVFCHAHILVCQFWWCVLSLNGFLCQVLTASYLVCVNCLWVKFHNVVLYVRDIALLLRVQCQILAVYMCATHWLCISATVLWPYGSVCSIHFLYIFKLLFVCFGFVWNIIVLLCACLVCLQLCACVLHFTVYMCNTIACSI